MTKKLVAVGTPFDPNYSSCSLLKPKTFSWTCERDSDAVGEVWMDRAVLRGVKQNFLPTPFRKAAWLCESSAIIQPIIQTILDNVDEVMRGYDLLLTHDRRLLATNHPDIVYCPPGSNLSWIAEDKQGVHEKTKRCSMIASAKRITRGHYLRHQVAESYGSEIDLYGGVFGSQRFGLGDLKNTWHDKSEGLRDYMFSFAIENDSYETYFTEKIMDCFVTGTVPVYWGSPDIGNYFNPEGIVKLDGSFDLNTLDESLYDKMKPAIIENYEIARSMEMSDDCVLKLLDG